MRAINQQAKKVMDILTEGFGDVEDYRKIDNTDGAFMPVTVQVVGKGEIGLVISVAHYFEQEGDLIQDPEMIFIKGQDGDYYPVTIQHPFQTTQYAVTKFNEFTGEYDGFSPRLQKDLAIFAGTWMRNIKIQQSL